MTFRLFRLSIRRCHPTKSSLSTGIITERLADGHLRYSVMVDGSWVHRAIDREDVTRTQCQEFIATAWTSARSDWLSGRKRRGAMAHASPEHRRGRVPANRRLPERLGSQGSSIRDWLGPDAISIRRIRVKVAAFHGAH